MRHGWHQVSYGGSTGWVWEDFVQSVSGSGSSSGSSNSGSSGSGSSPSGSSGSGSSSSGSSGSSGSSNSGSSSGRTGPSSGQHRQSAQGPYSQAWDRLAQCESSGNWSINTGNGYYGGLQFSESSWRWVGGSGLPHQASKQEQIERAYQLWQRQGWGAWPSCSRQLGLSGNPGGYGDSYYEVHGSGGSGPAGPAAASPDSQGLATYSVPLREEPSSSAERLAQIPRGAVLTTGERTGGWLKAQYDGFTGWVRAQYITPA
ncbi:hypothetical protein GCM10011359_20110 [Nesterenkonia alkaliphila]|nr:hypothetical protein GCM10011359_20110 [Nesterenkonia alkaliphila]